MKGVGLGIGPLARLQSQYAFLQGGQLLDTSGVRRFQPVHAGEVPAGKRFDSAQDSGLYVAHGFDGFVLRDPCGSFQNKLGGMAVPA